jgi:hypothetical protein
MQNQPISKLKSAIKDAKHVYVWVPFARTIPAGTTLGGYTEVYKTHIQNMMKEFALPTSGWDNTVQCAFRLTDTLDLYVEGFHFV